MAKTPSEYWLTTDTHFNHKVVTVEGLGSRPIDHGQKQLKWLRHFVRPDDVLIHLGDVIFGAAGELSGFLYAAPCRSKILIKGNHDRRSNHWYLNQGFDFVCDMIVIDNVLLSHKPQEFLPEGVDLNIHGHFHDTDHRKHEPQYSKFLDPKVHKLLALEHTGLKPVKLKDFVAQ
jgi:calcineurin-like phosphoesterase family protein